MTSCLDRNGNHKPARECALLWPIDAPQFMRFVKLRSERGIKATALMTLIKGGYTDMKARLKRPKLGKSVYRAQKGSRGDH
jgi:hypothetical protein